MPLKIDIYSFRTTGSSHTSIELRLRTHAYFHWKGLSHTFNNLVKRVGNDPKRSQHFTAGCCWCLDAGCGDESPFRWTSHISKTPPRRGRIDGTPVSSGHPLTSTVEVVCKELRPPSLQRVEAASRSGSRVGSRAALPLSVARPFFGGHMVLTVVVLDLSFHGPSVQEANY